MCVGYTESGISRIMRRSVFCVHVPILSCWITNIISLSYLLRWLNKLPCTSTLSDTSYSCSCYLFQLPIHMYTLNILNEFHVLMKIITLCSIARMFGKMNQLKQLLSVIHEIASYLHIRIHIAWLAHG